MGSMYACWVLLTALFSSTFYGDEVQENLIHCQRKLSTSTSFIHSFWSSDIGLGTLIVEVKSHSGCLLNEIADEQADLGRSADCSLLCQGPRKHESLWLRIAPIVREHAQQWKTRLPRDTAPNKSLLDQVISLNIFRSVFKRGTIFVKDLLHCTEGAAVSRVIQRCTSAEYRIL
jgi:hypothetical protein